jgi:hypothetical protein
VRLPEPCRGAFFDVHMTISAPFQVNAIGIDRGVPSLAM